MAYVIDETLNMEKAAAISESPSPAMLKLFEVGALCNNSSTVRNEDKKWLGQSTDVALLNVLDVLELPDPRPVSALYIVTIYMHTD
jgi:P-type Ca2+ transporter type 2C